uniref:Chitinase A1 n=1 Tax=Cacopsylla melanoneura TaxID=428564 RepID=A0A8D8U6W9_9HEMI
MFIKNVFCLVSLVLFHLIAIKGHELQDCWWTGCQSNDWAVTGCQPYNRWEANKTACDGGNQFHCCLACDWTGCEQNDWGVKGCEHLNKTESRRKGCEGGNKYLCCPRTEEENEGCWWTSCQEDSWTITGCEQYNREETGKEVCDGGYKYNCCPKKAAEPEPSGGFGRGYQCLWTPCFAKNDTEGGCPENGEQNGKQSCGDDTEMFNCCFKIEKEKDNDIEEVSGDSFSDFVKYLLFRARNFTIEPDLLPCTMMDPEKRALLKVKEEGLRICDLCPNFPQKRLANVFIDTLATETEYNIDFGDCFESCFSSDNCVAFSYDHGDGICYKFDSTVGTLKSDADWTTVYMTQPSGILNDWSYVRHTAITGNPITVTTVPDFLTCLENCETSSSCQIVSYSISKMKCAMFDNTESIEYVDLNYAYVSAFNIREVPLGKDVFWRFIEDGNILEATKVKADDSCAKQYMNKTHSAYYSKPCLTNEIKGCDSTTGCRVCYYPERVDDPLDAIICPDSDFMRKNKISEKLEHEMNQCLLDNTCMGIGYDKGKQSYEDIKIESFTKDYDVTYQLRYPELKSGLHKYLDSFEFLPNIRIARIEGSNSDFKTINANSYENCLEQFKNQNKYTKASYSLDLKLCHLGDVKIQFSKNTENKYITFFKKPSLKSHIKHFLRITDMKVDPSKAFHTESGCQKNCEEECASKCTSNEKCSYISVIYHADKTECFFFEDRDDLQPDLSGTSLTLVKLSSLDFSLDSFNKINPFQRQHIYDCFYKDNKQTQTSLTSHATNTTAVSIFRRKRGLFDAIGKAFKKAGEFIVDTVKDTVNTVVDTAKGVGKTIGKAVQGDFKGAKDAFLDIPVVKDVKNVVELGGAVVTGDWDKAKEKGIDLLQSSTLDLALSAIPGGKILGTAAKAGGKALKGATKAGKQAADRAKRSVGKGVDKVENKNKKVKDKKNDKETGKIEERGQCETRSKRAPKNKGKNKPGSCKKDDDDKNDDTKTCARPKIPHSIPETLSECIKKKAGGKCDYECDPGYDEEDPKITCKKINNKHTWPVDAKCTLKSCGAGPFPMIALETPQVSSFYQPALGKYVTVYVVLFDKHRKVPVWSVTMQQAAASQLGGKSYNTLKASARNKGFLQYPCTALKGHQANDDDYTNTGYDRGHLTPANVARWSPKAKKVINLFINIAPQDHWTNIYPWRMLEAHVECFSKKHSSLVATGTCLDGATDKTKTGGVIVPKCFWKMICYKDEKGKEQVVGFVHKNTKNYQKIARRREVYTPVSQAEVKAMMTGGGLPLIKNPWMMTATHVYKGRKVWFPVNNKACADADTISKEEKKAWFDALHKVKNNSGQKRKRPANKGKPKKKPNKKKTRRRRQNEESSLVRGCHSTDELEDILALLGYDSGAEDGEEDEGDEDEDDDENDIDVEPADGVSLVEGVASCKKRIVGYYTSWSKRKIFASHLKRLTHVIYAFIEMNADGSVAIGSADRATSEDPEKDKRVTLERLERLMDLASHFPHLKVMFAVGGWANSQYFSAMAASPDSRIRFIGSIIKLIEKFGFDGVDIDWEYPVTGGAQEGTASDKQNYVLLMQELRTALDNFASRVNREEKFLISFASAAGQWTLDPGYDLPGLLKYADFVNVMSYDFFGAWESKWGAYTGPPAPLFFGMPPRFSGKTNTDWTMKYYACKTKMPHKINMGVPFYGRFWKNVGDPVDKTDGMWRMATAVNGKFEGGYSPWNDIESEYLANGQFEKHFHEKSKTPYAWNPSTKTFLGYENEVSLTHKKNYAVDKNLGGIMIWALEQDDDDLSLLKTVASANLCSKSDPNLVNFKCSPIDEKRWWTSEDGDDKAGLCGRSAPLYKGYYPVCDPDDPGYSCCGAFGYCGFGDTYCKCPTCTDFGNEPDKITKGPIKPSVTVRWYFLNDPDGKRGRCGNTIEKINGEYPICNPDDDNAYCCSNGGYCGSTPDHCDCKDCVNFRKNPNHKF